VLVELPMQDMWMNAAANLELKVIITPG